VAAGEPRRASLPGALPAPDAAAVRAQVDKILASAKFAGSERMTRFLRFAVEKLIAGESGELKEYLVALEVFDRGPDFDQRLDPIVRVEARRLRSKLKTYYETEGRDDEIRIELPTGGYAPRIATAGREAPAQALADAPVRSVAALPFANLSPDSDSEYFSDGLTEELIYALTRVEGLRIMAWNTATKLRSGEREPVEVGRKLGVDAVLVGSVRRWGERVRITARLADVASGFCLWSETYDRRIEDLFAIQEELAHAIATSLRGTLLPAAPRPCGNLEAYDLYLKGRFHWNKRSPESFARAIDYFTQSIAVDPQCAVAHAGLADAYTLSGEYGLLAPDEAMPQAKDAASRALALDPNLAEAHTSLAIILELYEWQWDKAEEHYRRAIQLNPGYATAHQWYGCDHFAMLGRFDDAMREVDLAMRLDPLSPILIENRGYVLMLARRYDEALAQHAAGIEFDPSFYRFYSAMGRIYIQQGRYDEAIATLEKGLAAAGEEVPGILGALGQAHAFAGRPGQARALLSKLTEESRVRCVASSTRSLIHLALGETGPALDLLEESADRRDPTMTVLGVHPAFDPLRGEPRFAALLRRIGLAH
jgi:TolB-like protein/Flp pilus assembly protein TadD